MKCMAHRHARWLRTREFASASASRPFRTAPKLKHLNLSYKKNIIEPPQLHGVGWLAGAENLRVGMERGSWWQITWSRVWWSFPASASSYSIPCVVRSPKFNSFYLFFLWEFFSLISMISISTHTQIINFAGLWFHIMHGSHPIYMSNYLIRSHGSRLHIAAIRILSGS